jgi:RNA polymerase sigma-70 factor, ECF subfamily
VSEAAARAAEAAARASYGKLVAILALQGRDIAAAEDALSEALVSALTVWPARGVPQNPEGWLVTAARNRLRNAARAGRVRTLAEPELARLALPEDEVVPDHRLRLMFVCAHPAIDPLARTPLMLQTVLGIEAARVARAFLVEPAAMAQRLVRAKLRIRDAGLRFALPEPEEMAKRLSAVLDAVYAAFGQGWDGLETVEAEGSLTGEAIWLARLLVQLMPEEPEPKGLLALMLYCAARTRARRDAAGAFVPLADQDARLWDRTMVIEAEGLLTVAAQTGRFGRYQCEAAIQSVHVQRAVTGQLNHQALRVLYDLLVRQTDSIGARIGRAVVLADAGEPVAALVELEAIGARAAGHQPWWVARAHAARLAGQTDIARTALARAIALTEVASLRRWLEGVAETLGAAR